MALRIIVTALACYFLGNHNGAIYASLMMNDDVRKYGSGNAGLTNFIRNFGASKSVMVIAIDVLKAVLACLLAGLMFPENPIAGRTLGGVAVMVGHDFPALQGFKGGKGILSGWFISLMIDWRVFVLIGVVFFAGYLLSGYVSLGSVLSAATFGLGFLYLHPGEPLITVGTTFMSLLTLFQHRENIRRLLTLKERKTDLFAKGKKE